MRRLAIASLLLSVACLAPACEDAAPTGPTYPPGSTMFGKSYEEWSVAWWQWALALPYDTNPTRGGDCAAGQSGDVFFLAGNFGGVETRTCSVPSGKAIFFPIMNRFCRSCPEAGCDFARDTPALAACVAKGLDDAALLLEIDGVPVDASPFRIATAPFGWSAPADEEQQLLSCLGPVAANACGVPEGPRPGMTDGYWVMLRPLAAGTHVVRFGGTVDTGDGNPFSLDVQYTLTVE